jgi:hypothetical protein
MKITDKQANRILSACKALGAYPYAWESSDCKSDAQRNLSRRTHYVDDSTLRYFKARIIGIVRPKDGSPTDGLVYGIIESVSSKPEGGYIIRGAVFDVFGTVIHRTDWVRNRESGCKAVAAFLSSFDVVAHYRADIKGRVKNMRTDASRAAKLLAGKAVA